MKAFPIRENKTLIAAETFLDMFGLSKRLRMIKINCTYREK